jgi:hypothetical protein
MRDGGRRKWLRDAAPSALRDIEAALGAYWARRGDAIEHLYHLLAVDLRAAEAGFRSLFAEADRQHNSSRCYDLIRTLRERAELLDPALAQLLAEQTTRLAARNEEQYQRSLTHERNRDEEKV